MTTESPSIRDELQQRITTLSISPFNLTSRKKSCSAGIRYEESAVKLDIYPTDQQEELILEDLLYVLNGSEGRYIRVSDEQSGLINFTIERSLGRSDEIFTGINNSTDISLLHMVEQILPLVSRYVFIQRYITEKNDFKYGSISQAFCAALRHHLIEYHFLIVELEQKHKKENLTIQTFWFHVQPVMRNMDILYRLTSSSYDLTGGQLLNCIYDKMSSLSGDQNSKQMIHTLLTKASVPLFQMLEQWIYNGVINDPFQEFFIIHDAHVKKELLNQKYNDKYWEKCYTLRSEQSLPKFLSKVYNRVLDTGKYLNVIRECGIRIETSTTNKIHFTANENEYQEKINEAFQYASKKLLDLLINENQLSSHLKSLKNYFLLGQGDFFVHFLDLSSEELRKKTSDIMTAKLDSLLELSLRTSTAESDPHKDNLHCVLLSHNLTSEIAKILSIGKETPKREETKGPTNLGIEAFAFDYRVQWPVSLVINVKSLTKYRLIFRLLLICKLTEKGLNEMWLSNQETKRVYGLRGISPSVALWRKMNQYVQNLLHYITFEVLEPNWHTLSENLKTSTTIDQVLKYHEEFLDRSIDGCMLSKQEYIKAIMKTLVFCHTQTNRHAPKEPASEPPPLRETPAQRRQRMEVQTRMKKNEAKEAANMARMEKTFDDYLSHLIRMVRSSSNADGSQQMNNLVQRLDFNEFYRNNLERQGTTRNVNQR
ncbi:gamma-tubulin complex component 2 [Planoprotostelium fungivorum]|uniref:Spindle pole body component n=1 Tax=Planoprotostelium fungivorum TaxID=1890364 RepID=A0A2P6N3Y2_9EUKA|nr:gamma-tubulin complex component 2 [Planoprotostelium fungivorum]